MPAPDPGATARFGGGIACVDPRDGRFGVRLLRPAEEPTGLPEGGFADYEALRYRLGAPDGSRDMPVGQAFLLESGFERLNGVDWEKGCYVGQEVTARTHYRGEVRRQLTTVALDGAVAPGARIAAGGRPVGEMRSSLNGLGLALLRLDRIDEGTELEADGARLRVLAAES